MSDWKAAYEMWWHEYKGYLTMLEWEEAGFSPDPATAEAARNTALGLLSELALNFFKADQPADKCNDYAFALFDVGAVVGEYFSGDIDELFRDRVIEIAEQCGEPRLPLPKKARTDGLPWGTEWKVKIQHTNIGDLNHLGTEFRWSEHLNLEGTMKTPEYPTLKFLLGSKESLDAIIKGGGRETAFGLIRMRVLFSLSNFTIETTLNGTLDAQFKPDSYEDGGSIKYYSGFSIPSTPVKYKLLVTPANLETPDLEFTLTCTSHKEPIKIEETVVRKTRRKTYRWKKPFGGRTPPGTTSYFNAFFGEDLDPPLLLKAGTQIGREISEKKSVHESIVTFTLI